MEKKLNREPSCCRKCKARGDGGNCNGCQKYLKATKQFICEICGCTTPNECEGNAPNVCADCVPICDDYVPKTHNIRLEGEIDDVFVFSSFEEPLRKQISDLNDKLMISHIALSLMAKQLDEVYERECCDFNDEIGWGSKNEKQLELAYLEYAEKIFREKIDINNEEEIKMLKGIKRYDIGELLIENIKLKQSQNSKAIEVLEDIIKTCNLAKEFCGAKATALDITSANVYNQCIDDIKIIINNQITELRGGEND